VRSPLLYNLRSYFTFALPLLQKSLRNGPVKGKYKYKNLIDCSELNRSMSKIHRQVCHKATVLRELIQKSISVVFKESSCELHSQFR
jgi:hypothetical protein